MNAIKMSIPRFQHVKNLITQKIASGSLKSGESVPSEHELVKVYGYSRMTVNRALRELADDGIIRRVTGVGSFVAERLVQSENMPLMNPREWIERNNSGFQVAVRSCKKICVDELLAESFGMREGACLFYSEMLFSGNDTPLIVEQRYVNPLIAPDFLQQQWCEQTPSDYLLHVAPLQKVEEKICIKHTSKIITDLLNLENNCRVLQITRRTCSLDSIASTARLFLREGVLGHEFKLGHGWPDVENKE